MPRVQITFAGDPRGAVSAAKQVSASLNGVKAATAETAAETVAAKTAELESLERLAAEYRRLAAAAQQGSQVEVAASKLAADAEKRLAAAVSVTAREERQAAVAASHASAEISRLSRGALAGSGVFRGFGRSIAFASTGFLGGYGLTAALRGAFGEMEAGIRASTQTAAVLRSTGAVAGITAAGIDRLAQSEMQLSGVDDELIKQGANWLLTFRNVRNEAGKGNDIFNQAARATLDLAVAQANLNGTSVDLASATTLVGKALNDPLRGLTALQRVGVQFDNQQRAAIKRFLEVGDVVSAQKVILAELQAEVGGTAKAYGQELPGAISRARENVRNLAGSLLEGLSPAIKDAANRVSEWADEQQRTGELQEKVNRVVDDGRQVVEGFVGVVRTVAPVVREGVDAVGGLKNAVEILLALKFASVLGRWVGASRALIGVAGAEGAASSGLLGAASAAALLRRRLLSINGIVVKYAVVQQIVKGLVPGHSGMGLDFSEPTTPDTEVRATYKGKEYRAVKGTGMGDTLEKINAGAPLNARDLRALNALGAPTATARPQAGTMQLPTSFRGTHDTMGAEWTGFSPGPDAVDLMARPGVSVLAPEDGSITRISGHDPSSPPPNGVGGPWGRSFYYVGDSGTVYYGTHLSDVAPLGRYRKGDVIGIIGDYPGLSADHIHWSIVGSGPQAVAIANVASTQFPSLARPSSSSTSSGGSGTTDATTMSARFTPHDPRDWIPTPKPTSPTQLPPNIRTALARAGVTKSLADDIAADEQAVAFLRKNLERATKGGVKADLEEAIGGYLSSLSAAREKLLTTVPAGIRAGIAKAAGTKTLADDITANEAAVKDLRAKLRKTTDEDVRAELEDAINGYQSAVDEARKKLLTGLPGAVRERLARAAGTKSLEDDIAANTAAVKHLRAQLKKTTDRDVRAELVDQINNYQGEIDDARKKLATTLPGRLRLRLARAGATDGLEDDITANEAAIVYLRQRLRKVADRDVRAEVVDAISGYQAAVADARKRLGTELPADLQLGLARAAGTKGLRDDIEQNAAAVRLLRDRLRETTDKELRAQLVEAINGYRAGIRDARKKLSDAQAEATARLREERGVAGQLPAAVKAAQQAFRLDVLPVSEENKLRGQIAKFSGLVRRAGRDGKITAGELAAVRSSWSALQETVGSATRAVSSLLERQAGRRWEGVTTQITRSVSRAWEKTTSDFASQTDAGVKAISDRAAGEVGAMAAAFAAEMKAFGRETDAGVKAITSQAAADVEAMSREFQATMTQFGRETDRIVKETITDPADAAVRVMHRDFDQRMDLFKRETQAGLRALEVLQTPAEAELARRQAAQQEHEAQERLGDLTAARDAAQQAERDAQAALNRLEARQAQSSGTVYGIPEARAALAAATQERLKAERELNDELAAQELVGLEARAKAEREAQDEQTRQAQDAYQQQRDLLEDALEEQERLLEDAREEQARVDEQAFRDQRAALAQSLEDAETVREQARQAQADADAQAYQDARDALAAALEEQEKTREQARQAQADAEARAYQARRNAQWQTLQDLHDDQTNALSADLEQWGAWIENKQQTYASFLRWLAQNPVSEALGAAAPSAPPERASVSQSFAIPGQTAWAISAGKRQRLMFAEGGIVPGTYVGVKDSVVAQVTPGEQVIDRTTTKALAAFLSDPAAYASAKGGRVDAGRPIVLQVDGREFARIVAEPMRSEQARIVGYRSPRG